MKTIVIASGKGGTGKTLIATNIAKALQLKGKSVAYLDCDVEEPNGHLFLKPEIKQEKNVTITAPVGADENKCIACGKCVEACSYNAIALVKEKILFFPELCHVCGACSIVCPTDAIIEDEKKIGEIIKGTADGMPITYALLETGEGGMSPRLIQQVKDQQKEVINIIDSPPGTACPAVESIHGADLAVLVTDPTPFGIHDLKLAVNMCRKLKIEPVVLINRADYKNNDLKEYCKKAKLTIIGEIPDDRKIAEIYSHGGLLIEEGKKEYKTLFEKLSTKMETLADEKRSVRKPDENQYEETKIESHDIQQQPDQQITKKIKELVVISGKGGTGKTSLTASFAALSKKPVLADCDVDAADLHLITQPRIQQKGCFSGGVIAEINQKKCTHCGKCKEACRFHAIKKRENIFEIDPFECEGCGVCNIVCEDDAITVEDAINGEWYISETRLGPMAHATLGIAEENTGRLVSLVRDKATELSKNRTRIVVDGAPGTGCPVIASLTGVDFALIVTEPTVSGIHDMKRVIDVADHFGVKTGIIINKSDLNSDKTAEIKTIAKQKQIDIMGEIPYDSTFTDAQIAGLSIVEYKNNETTQIIKRIWEKIAERIA